LSAGCSEQEGRAGRPVDSTGRPARLGRLIPAPS